MSKKILITGATGFLGSNILRNVISSNHKAFVVKRPESDLSRITDIKDKVVFYDNNISDLNKLFSCHQIDIIIHCATNYGRISADSPDVLEENPIHLADVIESNMIFPVRLLCYAKKYKVPCFINTDTILNKEINSYSLSKKQFRQWLIRFSRDIVCVNIVLDHFYGPKDDDSKFIIFIVNKLLCGDETIDLTPGEQKRYFLFIEDVVAAFDTVIGHCHQFEKGLHDFHVGPNKSITIKEFVKLVKRISGNTKTKLNFGVLPYRENEEMNPILDNSAIKNLGWNPQISLEEGLKRMIEYKRGEKSL